MQGWSSKERSKLKLEKDLGVTRDGDDQRITCGRNSRNID